MSQQPPARRMQPPPLPSAMPAGGYGVPTAAPAHVPMLVTIWNYGKGAAAALGILFVLEAAGVFTTFRPSEAIGGFFGRVSGAEMAARQAAEAEYREKIAEAEARVQRTTMAYEQQLAWMTGAYTAAYQRLETVTQAAAMMEQEYLSTLAQTQRAGQQGNNLVANLADIGCAFGAMTNDPAFARACGVGSQIRRQNVREIERAVTQNAGQLTAKVMDGLPDPQNLAGHLSQAAVTAVPAVAQ